MSVRLMRFSVKGEGGHIEIIHAAIGQRTVTITCTCDGGRRALMCRHRRRLLEGDVSSILSGNEDEMSDLITAANATDFGRWFAIGRAYQGNSERVRSAVQAARERYSSANAKRLIALPARLPPRLPDHAPFVRDRPA